MSLEISGSKSISIAGFSTFLSILGVFDSLSSANVVRITWHFQRTCSLTSENVVRMTWNFQRTCSLLSSDWCVKSVIIEELLQRSIFQKIWEKLWPIWAHSLPPNFCKRCVNNLKLKMFRDLDTCRVAKDIQ